jgi:hypothetical protein
MAQKFCLMQFIFVFLELPHGPILPTLADDSTSSMFMMMQSKAVVTKSLWIWHKGSHGTLVDSNHLY